MSKTKLQQARDAFDEDFRNECEMQVKFLKSIREAREKNNTDAVASITNLQKAHVYHFYNSHICDAEKIVSLTDAEVKKNRTAKWSVIVACLSLITATHSVPAFISQEPTKPINDKISLVFNISNLVSYGLIAGISASLIHGNIRRRRSRVFLKEIMETRNNMRQNF